MSLQFLPAFPPIIFSKKKLEEFNDRLIESELKELSETRKILAPHLKSIPREFKTVSQRVNYLINK